MPAQDTVVIAKWKGATRADYKVVYWKETLTVGEYAVADVTYGKNGTVGNNVPTQNKTYEGFALNDQKSAGSVKITADGLAVKNVYYDRGQYTIKFYRYEKRKWNEDTSLRITARYGVDVSKEWEKACAKDGWGPDKNSNVQYTLIANMPAKNLDMYRKNAGSGKNIYYYVEGLTQGQQLTYATFDASSNVHLTEEDKMPITGFTFDSWHQYSDYWEYNLWLYYTRNSYELFFENCATMNPKKIKFEAPLSTGKPNREPGRPANIDNDYTFAGWYLDPGFTTKVDWNSKMPAEGVTIYAKWEIPKYDVSFETNGGDSIDNITVTKGDVLSDLPIPEKADDEFLGWYTDEALTQKYIYESKIVKDTVLYARWKSSDLADYLVKYVAIVDNQEIEIADSKIGTAELGTTVSEVAKTVGNYYPKATVLSVKITGRNQEIVFEYTPVEKWTYTVNYLLEGTQDAVPGSSSLQDETSDHELAVNFKSFEGYTLVSDPVVSVTKDKPDAVFFYREKKAIYHTQHWFERVSYVGENDRFGLHDITTTTGVESGISVSAQALDPVPEGFTLDTSIAGTIASGTTDIQNILTMKLFYVRSSYDVKYVIDEPLPEGVIVPTGGSYKYKETVTLEPTPSVPGYTFIGWETEDVTLSTGKFMMPTHDVTLKGRFVENAAVEIRYVPDNAEHGSTTNSPDMVSPVSGTPKGSIATAETGYAFKNWTKDGVVVSWNAELKPEDIAKVGGLYVASEYVANFGVDDNGDHIPDEYQIKVTYSAVNGSVDLKEAQYVTLYKDGHYATKEEGGVGTLADDQIAKATAANGYNQASESWNPEKPEAGITQFTEDTHYTISFAENAAVEIRYVPDNAEHGSTTNSPDMVSPVSGTPKGSIATAETGYAFKNWTKDGVVVSWNAELKPEDIAKVGGLYVASEYVANFGVDDNGDHIPDEYQTIFYYISADEKKGTVSVAEEVHTFRDEDGNYTEKTAISPNGSIATPLDGFAFDYWTDSEVNDYTPDMSKMKSNTYLVNTTFIAYFDVDEIGIEVPNEPDGVPDKYQIKFQYVSEDTNRGTVSGRVTEVKTVYEIVTGEDGNDHRELRPASPDANVTVSSLGSYLFNNWTDGSRGYANADEIRAAEFTQSTTFTAQFRFNGGGGTGPGGGGGPSGNTEGNNRYTPPTGGPGATTITPEDVPLAPLPESPVDVTLIDDGEVPLAPLPKTGQTSMRTTLTMMLSGIFVAVTALSKKRKEEDS